METATNGPRANALGQERQFRSAVTTAASPADVWSVLADLSTHPVWGGERRPEGYARIVEFDAPPGPASVGTEFTSVGEERMSRMRDRSVVTEATAPSVFEFVTESAMELRKGGQHADWTLVRRYEIEPDGEGSRVSLETRVTRVSELPGILRVFRIPVLRSIAARASAKQEAAGLGDLVGLVEERVGTR
jgi:Polyketide cyclase / dehydrase and lipid transport